jgi:hypothetical protein
MVLKPNILENDMCLSDEKYEIKNLHLSIGDYKFIGQFNVVSMYQDNVDIILGLAWVNTLGTFIFNKRRKFLIFSYKKKKITLQDITMKSISEAPSSKDLKNISEMIFQDNKKSIQKLQDRKKECDKIIIEKDEEISRLRNHNQKLLAKIMKSKEKKQCFQKLEQENQGLKEKLTEEEEEISFLSKFNQNLLEQIKRLKHDNKSFQEELDHKTSIVDKEAMTEPMKLEKSLDDTNPADVKRSSNVKVETIQGYEENSIPKVNQEKSTSIRSKDQVARMPYRHPNHKSQYFSQSMYQQKQITVISTNITSTISAGQNRSYHGSRNVSSSFQEPCKNPNPQKIELGWSDSFTI